MEFIFRCNPYKMQTQKFLILYCNFIDFTLLLCNCFTCIGSCLLIELSASEEVHNYKYRTQDS